MKTIFWNLLFFLVLVSSFCFAQEPCKEEVFKKWGLGIQVNQVRYISEMDKFMLTFISSDDVTKNNSFSFGLSAYYFTSKNSALRIRADRIKTGVKSREGSVPDNIGDTNLEQLNYEIAVGKLWQFRSGKMIFGCGFEIPIGFYGDYVHQNTAKAYSGGSYHVIYQNKIIVPGGTSYGVGAFGNFHYEIFNNFLAGFQVSSSLIKYKIGGNTSEELWQYNLSGDQTDYQFYTRETGDEEISVLTPIVSFDAILHF